jgi:Ca2+/Na+ antiporter
MIAEMVAMTILLAVLASSTCGWRRRSLCAGRWAYQPTGVSPLLASDLTIVGFGTSTPELRYQPVLPLGEHGDVRWAMSIGSNSHQYCKHSGRVGLICRWRSTPAFRRDG